MKGYTLLSDKYGRLNIEALPGDQVSTAPGSIQEFNDDAAAYLSNAYENDSVEAEVYLYGHEQGNSFRIDFTRYTSYFDSGNVTVGLKPAFNNNIQQ